MKNKILVALTLIIVVFLISFFYYKNEIEKKDRIELSMNISDSVVYGFSDSNLSKFFKYNYLNLYNFVDTNIFKNHTFKYSFNEIQKKYPLIDSLWKDVYGATPKEQKTRYGFGSQFYVDSNNQYYLLVYFPLDSTDKYGYDFNLLSNSTTYKVYQFNYIMDSIKAIRERLRRSKCYTNHEKTDIDRKFDSLKAVLKR